MSEVNEEKDSEYTHTHIHIHTLEKKRKEKNRRNFYIPTFAMITFQKLEEILKRENHSLSEWIREYAERYVLIHSLGNPQLLITRFAKELKAEKTCFFCQGHYPTLRKVQYISGLIAPTCEGCLQINLDKRTIKKMLGVVGE